VGREDVQDAPTDPLSRLQTLGHLGAEGDHPMTHLDADLAAERPRPAWEGLSPPYATIVADPPWRYNVTRGLPARGYKPSTADAHYSTMSMEEIAALPVGELADRDAHLYLWVTNIRLFGDRGRRELQPIDIARGWGFEYRTMLTWVKTGRIGVGFYFRGATEHVLFCTRGKAPIPPSLRESNVIVAPRGRHSQKPGAFLDKVARVSPSPYVELFARQPRFGWDSWGWGYEQAATP
jgi:N6-adenosine-specific RNA methylase IME4